MTEKKIREIYYYNRFKFSLNTYSQIDYVKLNETSNNLNTFFQNGQTKLIKQNGTYGGLLYVNKNTQGKNIENITNSTNVITISDDVGILIYMLPFNSQNLVIGDSYFTKPIYTSGGYLNKDIIIHQQALDNPEQTRKITIFY
jgi:hypothetical protein